MTRSGFGWIYGIYHGEHGAHGEMKSGNHFISPVIPGAPVVCLSFHAKENNQRTKSGSQRKVIYSKIQDRNEVHLCSNLVINVAMNLRKRIGSAVNAVVSYRRRPNFHLP